MELRFTLEELNTVSEIDIVYKNKSRAKITERPQIKSSRDAYQVLLHYWNMDKIELIEEFKVLYLNNANRVLSIMNLSSGSVTTTVADVKLILVPAIKIPAQAIVLAHNHPSGNTRPSQSDIIFTKNIRECAAMLDIKLLDHIIVSVDGYCSFAEEGEL